MQDEQNEKTSHMSFGSWTRKLLVMADLPVPVGPTMRTGISFTRKVRKKKACRVVSLVSTIKSLTCFCRTENSDVIFSKI